MCPVITVLAIADFAAPRGTAAIRAALSRHPGIGALSTDCGFDYFAATSQASPTTRVATKSALALSSRVSHFTRSIESSNSFARWKGQKPSPISPISLRIRTRLTVAVYSVKLALRYSGRLVADTLSATMDGPSRRTRARRAAFTVGPPLRWPRSPSACVAARTGVRNPRHRVADPQFGLHGAGEHAGRDGFPGLH